MPIEELGYYNPRSKELVVDREAVQKWMTHGAQQSETVASLLKGPRAVDQAALGA
jgi:small subunit ribosomal protein S16